MTKKTKKDVLSFRSLVDPRKVTNPESRQIYQKLLRDSGRIPEIYQVRALADNSRWLKLLDSFVFRWPRSCSLDEKTKELVGLAKSIAYLWEPGVLTNIEGALEAGAKADEITEAILVASTVSAFANAEKALCTASVHLEESAPSSSVINDAEVLAIYDDAGRTIGSIPELYTSKLLVENVDWLGAIHQSTKIQYSHECLDQKTKALVRLAASAAKGWERGIREHSSLALSSGATRREITDVLASIYKTTASIGVQVGFGVPCSIPEIQGFKLLKDYYSTPKRSHQNRVRRRR